MGFQTFMCLFCMLRGCISVPAVGTLTPKKNELRRFQVKWVIKVDVRTNGTTLIKAYFERKLHHNAIILPSIERTRRTSFAVGSASQPASQPVLNKTRSKVGLQLFLSDQPRTIRDGIGILLFGAPTNTL